MKRNNYSDYSIAQNQAQQMALDKTKRIVGGVKQLAKEAYKNPGQAAKFAGRQIMANKGKAGMALAGLAAAGGLGIAGLKAAGARKKKANSPLGKVLNGNPALKKGAIGLSKRLNKMGIKN